MPRLPTIPNQAGVDPEIACLHPSHESRVPGAASR